MSAPALLGEPEAFLGAILLGGEPSLAGFMESGNPVAHWRFDEASGTVAHDLRGTYDGTYAGSPTFGVSGPATPCVTFGSSSERMHATGTLQGTSAQTVEAWVKVSALPTSTNKGLVAGLYESSTKTDKCLYVTSDGKINFNVNQSGTVRVASSAAAAFPIGRWNHVVGVLGTASAVVYINGVSAGTVSATSFISNYASDNIYVGGGTADTYVALPGSYDEVAIYNTALTAAQILARYNEGVARIATTNLRVTQEVVEILRDSSGRKARITQVLAEVLRASAVGFAYSKAATTNFTMHVAAAPQRDALVSATTSFTITPTAASIAVHTWTAAAETDFTLSDAGVEVRDIPTAAETDFTASVECHPVFDYAVAGAGAFTLSSTAAKSRGASALATTSFTVHNAPSASRWVFAVAETDVTLSDIAAQHTWFVYSVSAETDFTLDSAALYIPDTTKLVVGETIVALHAAATGVKIRNLAVGNQIVFGQIGRRRISPVIVSASTDFLLGVSSSHLNPGLRPVDAETAMTLQGTVTFTLFEILYAAATTAFSLSSSVLTSFAFAVSAATSVTFTGAAKGGRDIHVSAITSMSMSPGPDSNDFFLLDGESAVTFGMIAASGIGYTPAGNSFVFTDLAVARIKLPWRFRPLPLPSGGGLPHS